MQWPAYVHVIRLVHVDAGVAATRRLVLALNGARAQTIPYLNWKIYVYIASQKQGFRPTEASYCAGRTARRPSTTEQWRLTQIFLEVTEGPRDVHVGENT